MADVTVTADGVMETLRAVQTLEVALRRQTNGELRAAAGRCASVLADELRGAAAGAATPQARLVARTVQVKSDRLPAVALGGSAAVGRYGAPASALLWGSEHGGHNFAAGPNGAGYWIGPTVERFQGSSAVTIYRDAVAAIVAAAGL